MVWLMTSSGNYLTKIGSALKRELRKDLVVEKGNC
jgi:6-phosphogluconate dehydrogenase (decarboxylating)